MPNTVAVGNIVADATLNTKGFFLGVDKMLQGGLRAQNSMRGVVQSVGDIGRQFTILAVTADIALKKVGQSIIGTLSKAENLGVVMGILTEETGRSGAVFNELAEYAATVPFEIDQIAQAFVILTGITKGSIEESKAWLPVLSDIAAIGQTLGITYEQSATQFARMMTQGTGAVDLFRDRGLLAILGLDSVNKSMAEFREELFETLTGPKFKDAAAKVQNTFQGIMSAIRDQFTLLKLDLFLGEEGGIFEDFKNGLRKVLNLIEESRPKITAWVKDNEKLVEGIILATGATAALVSGLVVLGYVIPPVTASLALMGKVIQTGLNVALSLLALNLRKAFLLLIPVSGAAVGWALIGAAVFGVAYAFRAAYNEGGLFHDMVNKAIADVKDGFNDLLSTVEQVFTRMAYYFGVAHNKYLKFTHLINPDPFKSITTPEIVASDDALDAMNAFFEGKGDNPLTPVMTGAWTSFVDTVTEGAEDLHRDVFVPLSTSISKQFDKDIEHLKGSFSSLIPFMDELFAASGEAISPERFGGLTPDFDLMGERSGTKDKTGKKSKQEQEFERLREAGNRLFLTLNPVRGLMAELVESLSELDAAGQTGADTLDALRQSLFKTFEDKLSVEEFETIEGVAALFGGTLSEVATGLADMAESAKTQEMIEDAEALLSQYKGINEVVVDLNADLQLMVEYFKVTGGELSQGQAEVFATSAIRRYGADTSKAIDALIDKLQDLPPAVRDAMKKTRDEVEKSELAEKFNESWDAIQSVASAVASLPGKFGQMGQAAVAAFAIIRAAQAAASGGLTEIAALVVSIIQAFGFLGGESEKTFSDMDLFLQDLGDTVEDIADKMTDAIVEFARTGKAEVGDLVDYILEEFLRAGVANLIVNPALDFGIDLLGFAKGGVFGEGGKVIDSPTFFKAGDGLGVAGEAGEEGILPLKRIDGKLGVIAEMPGGRGVTVNVYGAPAENVEVNKRQVGGETVVDVIFKVVNSGIIGGQFDGALRTARSRI